MALPIFEKSERRCKARSKTTERRAKWFSLGGRKMSALDPRGKPPAEQRESQTTMRMKRRRCG